MKAFQINEALIGILVGSACFYFFLTTHIGLFEKSLLAIVIIAGFYKAIVGYNYFKRFQWVKKNGAFAQGRLVKTKLIKNNVETIAGAPSRVYWDLTVEWTHPNGQKYLCNNHKTIFDEPFESGFFQDKNKITVQYNPLNPDESILVFDKIESEKLLQILSRKSLQNNQSIYLDRRVHIFAAGFFILGLGLIIYATASSKDLNSKIIALFVGGSFIGTAYLHRKNEKKKEALVNHILTYGQSVVGCITDCGFDQSSYRNTRTTYKIEAEWVHPITKKVFKARTIELLKNDPAKNIPADRKILIKYNPNNPEECVIVPDPRFV